jgi:hypothetical protein
MMEAVRTSETSVYSNDTTRRYIPEGSRLHVRRREDPKSHMLNESSGNVTLKMFFSGMQNVTCL